jgi:hypothetical protein
LPVDHSDRAVYLRLRVSRGVLCGVDLGPEHVDRDPLIACAMSRHRDNPLQRSTSAAAAITGAARASTPRDTTRAIATVCSFISYPRLLYAATCPTFIEWVVYALEWAATIGNRVDPHRRWDRTKFQQKHGRCVVLGESTEYRALRHAIAKAHGDRERSIRNVLPTLRREQADALPGAIRAAVSGTARRRASTFSGLRCANFRLGRLTSWHAFRPRIIWPRLYR